MTTNRTPDEYQFTLTIESRTPISNLDVLSSLEIDFDDADSITCDPVVKESLTTDTAYREGFEAGAKMMQVVCAHEASNHWENTDPHDVVLASLAIAKKIWNVPLPTPTTEPKR